MDLINICSKRYSDKITLGVDNMGVDNIENIKHRNADTNLFNSAIDTHLQTLFNERYNFIFHIVYVYSY